MKYFQNAYHFKDDALFSYPKLINSKRLIRRISNPIEFTNFIMTYQNDLNE